MSLDWNSINLTPRPETGPDKGKDGWALHGKNDKGERFYAGIGYWSEKDLDELGAKNAYLCGQETLLFAVRKLAYLASGGVDL